MPFDWCFAALRTAQGRRALPGALAALALLAAACGGGYSRAEVRYNLAQDLLEERQWEAALIELDAAIALDPSLLHAHFERGRLYLTLGNYERAQVDLTEALRADPGDARAYRYRITASMVLGDLDRALCDAAALSYLSGEGALVPY